jgi:hypothetical protein
VPGGVQAPGASGRRTPPRGWGCNGVNATVQGAAGHVGLPLAMSAHHCTWRGVLTGLTLLAIAGCAGGAQSTGGPAQSAAPSAGPLVQHQDFSARLPTGWTVQGPTSSDGAITYQIESGDGSLQGQVGILDLNNPSAPADQVTELETEAITTLALQVDGTQVGSTNVDTTEPVHDLTVAGETCAQLAVQSTYQGSTADGIYLNCRHDDVLYSVMFSGGSTSVAQLDDVMASIAGSWKWS